MKAIISCLLITIFICSSCNKESTPKGAPNPKYNVPIDTKIEGLHDITMQQNSTYDLPIAVKYLSGTKELVSIALTDLPNNVFVSITPQIDTPNYSSIIKFNVQNADTGTTTVTLMTAASKEASARSYTFNLTITPEPVNYAPDLAGLYTHAGTCDNVGTVNNQAIVSTDPNVINRIRIERVWTGSTTYFFYADINAATHTINIPAQTNNGILYTGSGTYSDNQMNIMYQFGDGNLINDACTVTLTR